MYQDNAARNRKNRSVIDSVDRLNTEANANVHRDLYSLGSESTERFENSRTKVADFINSNSAKEIIFTSGTTESINLLARSLGNTLNPGDEILISEMEHHSNIVPWQLTAERTGTTLNYIPVTETGELDLSEPDHYFKPNTKIVSITHISNVLGTINPVKKLAEMAHEMGALFIVDGEIGRAHV